jgi:hypothetical protein
MDFLKEIVKEIGDDYTKLAADIDETETYVDTGSYIFNALVSGSVDYCYCWRVFYWKDFLLSRCG